MTSTTLYSLCPVGFVRSRLTAREDAPKQGSEGAPEAWVEIDPVFVEALDGIAAAHSDEAEHFVRRKANARSD